VSVPSEGGCYFPNGLLLLPPSAFFLIGLVIWLLRSFKTDQVGQYEFGISPNTKGNESH